MTDDTTTHVLSMVELSCSDVPAQARFWSTVLGVPLDLDPTEDYAQLSPGDPAPKWLFIRRDTGAAPGALTLALTSDDLAASVAAARTAGARHEGDHELDGFRWSELRDPEGNRFTFNAPPPR